MFYPLKMYVCIVVLSFAQWTTNAEESICSSRKEVAQENIFALTFCHIYPQKSCCLPVHDAEIEEHYFNLLEAGEICAKQTSKAKDFLKAVFCYACSPEQPEFIGSPYNPDLFTNDTEEVVRVCKTAAIEIHPGKFSDCGMTLVAERGNIPAGDDTIVPMYFWPDCSDGQYSCQSSDNETWSCQDTPCGNSKAAGLSDIPCTINTSMACSGIFSFLNDNRGAKPPFFEAYPVEIVDADQCMTILGENDERCKCYTFRSNVSTISPNCLVFIIAMLVPFFTLYN